LKLYNSLGQKYQYLELKENSIKIYLCGPTVQSPPHLGHGKSVVSFDVLIRYLRSLNQKVTYVRNITDIEDKIIDKALEESIGFEEISKRNSLIFKKTYADLNCLQPDFEPEATKYISEILNLIDLLFDKGYAYHSPSGVYFSVNKYSRYMELSNRKLDDTVSGERINLEEDKESKEDFALWKASKEGEPYWESKWGNGRPGWHIECSAMVASILGTEIDIHCGGNDLIFPHHENEIAQSQAGYDVETFSNFWLHNGMLQLAGKKMAKSTGHVKPLLEYIDIYGGEVIRFFYLRSHYRSPQEFSEELLKESRTTLNRIKYFVGNNIAEEIDHDLIEKFNLIMNDDLNTPKAIALIFNIIKDTKRSDKDSIVIQNTIGKIMSVLGFDLNDQYNDFEKINLKDLEDEFNLEGKTNLEIIQSLINKREEYRNSNDYKMSDEMRDRLLEFDIELEDNTEQTDWFWRNS